VLLRYESSAVPVETARQMTAVLDEEFTRISHQLGCSAEERVIAIVQSRDAYRKSTDTAEWSGGQFDGKIRRAGLRTANSDQACSFAGARNRSRLPHHAGTLAACCRKESRRSFPAIRLSAAQLKKIADMTRQGKLPRLSNLKQDWSRMDAEHAAEATPCRSRRWNCSGRNRATKGCGYLPAQSREACRR